MAHLGGRHWRDLGAIDLKRQQDALAFLSPEGFRFYVPAFVRFALLDFEAADLTPEEIERAITCLSRPAVVKK